MNSDRLGEVQQRLREFSEQREWTQFHNPKNLAMLIASEAGELLAELRWIPGDESDGFVQDPEVRKRIEQEVADILIGILILCERIKIDPYTAINDKIEINTINYPTDRRGMPNRKKA